MDNKKFCKYCGEKIDKDSIVCPKCGRQLEKLKSKKTDISTNEESKANNNEIENEEKFYKKAWFMWVMLIFFAPIGILFMWKFHPEMKKNTKIILTIIFAIFFLIIIGSSSNDEEDTTNSNNKDNISEKETTKDKSKSEDKSDSSKTKTPKGKKDTYGLGETFNFDDLEITLGNEVSFSTVKNKYSEYNGKDAIRIPVTVKNLKDETHGLNMFFYTAYGSKGTKADNLSTFFDDNVDFAGDLRSGASYTKYFYIAYDGDGEYAIEFSNYSQKITVEFNITK